ncbi:cysteine peptidase family C39 domain-containing protein, partial [Candidatus Omnitrophota bacterium]
MDEKGKKKQEPHDEELREISLKLQQEAGMPEEQVEIQSACNASGDSSGNVVGLRLRSPFRPSTSSGRYPEFIEGFRGWVTSFVSRIILTAKLCKEMLSVLKHLISLVTVTVARHGHRYPNRYRKTEESHISESEEASQEIEIQPLKSRFPTWIRAIALLIVAVFLPEQIAWAMEYSPSILFPNAAQQQMQQQPQTQQQPGNLIQGGQQQVQPPSEMIIAENVKRSLNSLTYKTLKNVSLDENLEVINENEDGIFLTRRKVNRIYNWLLDPATKPINCGIQGLGYILKGYGIETTLEEMAILTILTDIIAGTIEAYQGQLLVSLYSLSEVANNYDVTLYPVQMAVDEDIFDLKIPFIVHIKAPEHFALVESVQDDTVRIIINNIDEPAEMSKQQFLSVLSGYFLLSEMPERGAKPLTMTQSKQVRGAPEWYGGSGGGFGQYDYGGSSYTPAPTYTPPPQSYSTYDYSTPYTDTSTYNTGAGSYGYSGIDWNTTSPTYGAASSPADLNITQPDLRPMDINVTGYDAGTAHTSHELYGFHGQYQDPSGGEVGIVTNLQDPVNAYYKNGILEKGVYGGTVADQTVITRDNGQWASVPVRGSSFNYYTLPGADTKMVPFKTVSYDPTDDTKMDDRATVWVAKNYNDLRYNINTGTDSWFATDFDKKINLPVWHMAPLMNTIIQAGEVAQVGGGYTPPEGAPKPVATTFQAFALKGASSDFFRMGKTSSGAFQLNISNAGITMRPDPTGHTEWDKSFAPSMSKHIPISVTATGDTFKMQFNQPIEQGRSPVLSLYDAKASNVNKRGDMRYVGRFVAPNTLNTMKMQLTSAPWSINFGSGGTPLLRDLVQALPSNTPTYGSITSEVTNLGVAGNLFIGRNDLRAGADGYLKAVGGRDGTYVGDNTLYASTPAGAPPETTTPPARIDFSDARSSGLVRNAAGSADVMQITAEDGDVLFFTPQASPLPIFQESDLRFTQDYNRRDSSKKILTDKEGLRFGMGEFWGPGVSMRKGEAMPLQVEQLLANDQMVQIGHDPNLEVSVLLPQTGLDTYFQFRNDKKQTKYALTPLLSQNNFHEELVLKAKDGKYFFAESVAVTPTTEVAGYGGLLGAYSDRPFETEKRFEKGGTFRSHEVTTEYKDGRAVEKKLYPIVQFALETDREQIDLVNAVIPSSSYEGKLYKASILSEITPMQDMSKEFLGMEFRDIENDDLLIYSEAFGGLKKGDKFGAYLGWGAQKVDEKPAITTAFHSIASRPVNFDINKDSIIDENDKQALIQMGKTNDKVWAQLAGTIHTTDKFNADRVEVILRDMTEGLPDDKRALARSVLDSAIIPSTSFAASIGLSSERVVKLRDNEPFTDTFGREVLEATPRLIKSASTLQTGFVDIDHFDSLGAIIETEEDIEKPLIQMSQVRGRGAMASFLGKIELTENFSAEKVTTVLRDADSSYDERMLAFSVLRSVFGSTLAERIRDENILDFDEEILAFTTLNPALGPNKTFDASLNLTSQRLPKLKAGGTEIDTDDFGKPIYEDTLSMVRSAATFSTGLVDIEHY